MESVVVTASESIVPARLDEIDESGTITSIRSAYAVNAWLPVCNRIPRTPKGPCAKRWSRSNLSGLRDLDPTSRHRAGSGRLFAGSGGGTARPRNDCPTGCPFRERCVAKSMHSTRMVRSTTSNHAAAHRGLHRACALHRNSSNNLCRHCSCAGWYRHLWSDVVTCFGSTHPKLEFAWRREPAAQTSAACLSSAPPYSPPLESRSACLEPSLPLDFCVSCCTK